VDRADFEIAESENYLVKTTMIQPPEMKLDLPMKLSNNVRSTTTRVWEILVASRDGNLDAVKKLVGECPELIYAQYNYTPPIHFAVREGHVDLVGYLLDNGALDTTYITYPFKDTLVSMAQERGHTDIASLLQDYLAHPERCRFKGDNGEILYQRSALEREFETAVDNQDLGKTSALLVDHPELALDNTFFWGEGILMMPAKDANHKMLELLMSYGATVPPLSKWGRFYYFKHYETAAFLLENGMDPNHKTWHHVTLLHDMAQAGDIPKAELLLKHGAEIDPVDEEYNTTPFGMALRWGHKEMVEFLQAHLGGLSNRNIE